MGKMIRALEARLHVIEATARLAGVVQDGARTLNVNMNANMLVNEATTRKLCEVYLLRHPALPEPGTTRWLPCSFSRPRPAYCAQTVRKLLMSGLWLFCSDSISACLPLGWACKEWRGRRDSNSRPLP
jgi:hypothetical protein